MKKIVIIAGILAAFLVTAVYYGVNAQQPEPQKPKRPVMKRFQENMQRMKRNLTVEQKERIKKLQEMRENMKLNLTDEQKEKIRTIVSESRKELITQMADIKVASIELQEVLADKSTADAVVMDKHEAIQRLRERISRSKLNTKLQVRQVMTEEQWGKAKKLRRFAKMRMLSRRAGKGVGMWQGRRIGMMRSQGIGENFRRAPLEMRQRGMQAPGMRFHQMRSWRMGPWGSYDFTAPGNEHDWMSGDLDGIFNEWESVLGTDDFSADEIPDSPDEKAGM